MKRVFLICCVFLLGGLNLSAQVSGYLGKRTIVGIETRFFPNVWQTLSNDQPVRLNAQAGLQMERVLTRSLSAGIHVQALSSRTFYETAQGSGRIAISGQQFGIDIRSYTFRKRGNIPPLGPQHRFGLSFLRYQLRDLNLNYYPDGRRDLGTYQAAVLNYSLMTQRVYLDKYVLSTGVNFSWVIPFTPSGFPLTDSFLWDRSVSRLRGFFAGQLVVGIGVLL